MINRDKDHIRREPELVPALLKSRKVIPRTDDESSEAVDRESSYQVQSFLVGP